MGILANQSGICQVGLGRCIRGIALALVRIPSPGLWPAAVAGLGCATIPPGMAAIDGVNVEGNRAVSAGDIREKIATTASPKFFGVVPGFIHDYSLYDRSVLQRDLERVERYYRARGHYEAQVRAGRVHYKNRDHVEIMIEVEEGEPVRVRDVRIEGLGGLPEGEAEAVRDALARHLKRDAVFEEEAFDEAQTAMARALTDRGYAWAKIERRADVDLPGHFADLHFVARPGPKARYGPIRFEGLGDLPEGPARRALDIILDNPYSTNELDSAQMAVLDLGTFTSVEILPDLPEPPPRDAVVPLLVRVQRQKLRSVLLGGGVEVNPIRTGAHLRAGWEHKNLFGGFRHFTVDLRPGVVLYPTRLPDFQEPTALLPEERFRAELRQPGLVEARTNGVIVQEVNTFPVLLTPESDPKVPVIGYLEYKGTVGLDRTLWRLFGAVTYNLQHNQPFAYVGRLHRDLGGIVVSYIDLLTHLDLRDDKVEPRKGLFVQNDLQFAGLGGDALDLRVQPEVRGYVPLGDEVTIAARASVGFLFPLGYGSAARAAGAGGGDAGAADPAGWVKDSQLIHLRGFFSGGPASNRGYPLRGVGPHGVVPFFSPELRAQALAAECDEEDNPNYSRARCGVPLGGLSLWEASIEVRFPIAGAFGGVTFCDASDVSAESVDLRFDRPHLSCGLGLRYDTPIGPVRLDAGYRVPGAQVLPGAETRDEGKPPVVYGVPIAISFGIGEAF